MFYVQATLQEPPGFEMHSKETRTRFPREVYVTWDSIFQLKDMPVFLGINNPPKPVPMEEAERLLSKCEEVHGWMYDHNLRIVPA
jgi:hypothetical protein